MATIYNPPPVPGSVGGGGTTSGFMGLGSTGGYVSSITPTGGGGGTLSSYGGGGGTGGSNILQQLLASLQKTSGQARTDQNAQYQNLLKSVAGTSSDVMGSFNNAQSLLGTQGQTAHQQVADNLVSQNASTEQDAVNRGIGNTTIRAGMLRGNANDAAKQNQSINENVAGQQANLLTQRAGAQLQLGNLSADSILSKSIQQPDTAQYLALLAQLGQNSGAMGGGLNVAANGLMGMNSGGGSKTSGGAVGGGTSAPAAGGGATAQPAAAGGYNGHAGSAAGSMMGAAAYADRRAAYDKEVFQIRNSGQSLSDAGYRQLAAKYGIQSEV